MTKMIKHLGAFFLVFVMIFATVITACAAEYENKFTDVSENAWYAEAVKYCDENGLMVQEEIPFWGQPKKAGSVKTAFCQTVL